MPYSFDAIRFAAASPKADTGYEASSLRYMWDKYNGWHNTPAGSFGGLLDAPDLEMRAYDFYCIYMLLHQSPQNVWASPFRSKTGCFKMSMRTARRRLPPLALALATIIDEVDYERRLDRFNHGIAPFDYLFTGIVDTLPVYVPQPHRWALARLLYQPKYGACVYKYQLGITFAGEIVLFTGPHLGTTPDVTIWEATWAQHPFYDWELWLGDLGYVGADGIVTKFKRSRYKRTLANHEIFFNNVHEHVRNRAEQIVSVIKAHRIFKRGTWRGRMDVLKALVKIAAHTAAHELSLAPRFDVYGPWDHVY